MTTSGTRWVVKNTFELKNAQDVLVEGNVFENLWVADQSGYPIVFTPRNQSGTAPWVVVQRVTFQNNLIRHTAGGVNILGTDNNAPSQRTNTHPRCRATCSTIMIGATWGTGSRPFMLGDGPEDVAIEQNTVITTELLDRVFLSGSAEPDAREARYVGNMSAHNALRDSSATAPASACRRINAYMPQGTVTGNVLAGGKASNYPAGNFFPTVAAWQAEFVDYAAGDYHLRLGSPYAGLGADIDAINAQTANALSGDNSVPPGTGRVSITTTASAERRAPAASIPSRSCAPAARAAACGSCASRRCRPASASIRSAGLISGVPSEVQTGSIALDAYDPTWPASRASVTLAAPSIRRHFVVTMPPAPAAQVGVRVRS